ncbi:phytanoyl-CoA dioxygenase family protein [Halobacillus sp. BAB-2008]|uniref:phytanoyl-CoA dioxygenase family protein n=1 Tax=Halobacillus sp. BAB-2008 TaxID=1246484 RepID=UPI0002A51C44|nr:phytanoyl-CoA dioxygenase family protein [Halobacillus sp. BAB-2008]ELK45393.1 phytanoyl-CoA dioxygenase [Halobacillus sp. BAB-2008]
MNGGISSLPDLENEFPLSAQLVEEYQEKGHVCIRNLAAQEEIRTYRNVIKDAVQDYAKQAAPLEERDTFGKAFLQVMNLWEKSKEVEKFVLAERFGKVAADLLGVEGVRIYHDQALYKEPGGGHTPWHQDQTFWPLDTNHTITMWMPLVDISEEMGSLSFASKSQLEGYISKLGISDDSHATLGRRIEEKAYDIVTHGAMKAGDATFHNGWTLHSAPGNPTDQTREVMTVIYVADGAQVSAIDTAARKKDQQQWLPGLGEGDLVESRLNPIVYRK